MLKMRPDVKTLSRIILLVIILAGLKMLITAIAVNLLGDYFSAVNWRFTLFDWFRNLLMYPHDVLFENGVPFPVMSILVGPILEELEFRGPLLVVLKLKKTAKCLYDKQYLLWIIILTNGILFGLAHSYTNPVFLFSVGLGGIFYCYLVARTRLLWPAIAMHVLLNFIATVNTGGLFFSFSG